MISPDGDITVTNDGATIMGQMQVSLDYYSLSYTPSSLLCDFCHFMIDEKVN